MKRCPFKNDICTKDCMLYYESGEHLGACVFHVIALELEARR